MQKVSVVAFLQAKVGLEERVRQELLILVDETRKEKGCLNYDLHVDTEDPAAFVFYENWVSRMALANHLETAHFQKLVSLQDELLACPPRINVMKMVSDPK